MSTKTNTLWVKCRQTLPSMETKAYCLLNKSKDQCTLQKRQEWELIRPHTKFYSNQQHQSCRIILWVISTDLFSFKSEWLKLSKTMRRISLPKVRLSEVQVSWLRSLSNVPTRQKDSKIKNWLLSNVNQVWIRPNLSACSLKNDAKSEWNLWRRSWKSVICLTFETFRQQPNTHLK